MPEKTARGSRGTRREFDCRSAHAERFRDARTGATNSDRRRALWPASRVDPWVLRLDLSRRSDPEDPENSLGSAVAATLTSLRGPSLEAP